MDLPGNSKKLMNTGLAYSGMLGAKVRIVPKKVNNHLRRKIQQNIIPL